MRKENMMAEIADKNIAAPEVETAERRPLPRWVITTVSVGCLVGFWEIFGRDINPVFGSYPSAIAVAFWELLKAGTLWKALFESLQPFLAGYLLAIVVGIRIAMHTPRARQGKADHEL